MRGLVQTFGDAFLSAARTRRREARKAYYAAAHPAA
jgi:hypothetical protein